METSGSGARIMSGHSHNTHNNEIINSVFITSVSFNYSCGYILISWSREREWCCQKVQVMGINVSRRCITQLRRNMNIISDFSGYKWRHRSPQEIVQVSRVRSRVTRAQESAGHWSQAEQSGARFRPADGVETTLTFRVSFWQTIKDRPQKWWVINDMSGKRTL